MSFGITTFRANGTPIITPDGAGGVFVTTIFYSSTSPATTTFTGINGMSLRIFPILGGGVTYVTGNDGNGDPYITFTITGPSDSQLSVLVFAA